ncbi:S-layer homology domain-containing protein [Paenibacillus chartarius]|uniref:S-layer homology domain-containing protein n=1 Tax=Paenibacillus chartarius TaxID=747481 RepID=A0ABV6DKE0_9BACL
MNNKWKRVTLIGAVVLSVAVGGASAYGFEDTKGDPAEAEINALSQAGIINGITESQFNPRGTMTLAQGIHMIVKGLGLNLDALRFIKEPVATDMFDHVANDAWYAQSMIIAFHNGLTLPRSLDPNANLTEGAFASLLIEGLRAKTEQEPPATLFGDAAGSKAELSRSKAAQLITKAITFLKNESKDDQKEQPVLMERTKAAEGVDLVTLTWPARPTAGYSVKIEGIDFEGTAPSGIAVIRYSLHEPKPGSINAQVISDVQATAYVGSDWKIELKPVK